MIVLRLLGRAALRILPVLAGVSVLAFALVHLIPGDPAVVAAGLEASPATVERIRRDLGLDRSLPRQFADFAARVVRGDLGVSIRTGRPVGAEIAERLPHTAILTVGAVGLAVVLGMSAGLLAAVTRRPAPFVSDAFDVRAARSTESGASVWFWITMAMSNESPKFKNRGSDGLTMMGSRAVTADSPVPKRVAPSLPTTMIR